MTSTPRIRALAALIGVGLLVLASPGARCESGALSVCATTTDLGALAREIGGDEVEVEVFGQGPQDPHNVLAKPSFVKALHRADLLLAVGLDLEEGWLPPLLRTARNSKVRPGGPGFIDASRAITPMEVPRGPIDRSLGDVHARGNPHYFLDPLNGLKAARLIHDKLVELRPEKRERFAARLESFTRRIAAALVGEELAAKRDAKALLELLRELETKGAAKWVESLEASGERRLLGGWLGKTAPHRGSKVVADHRTWSYFAARFGLEVIGYMEPRPGISPTTRHLADLVESMRKAPAKAILSSTYFDRRHAEFLARQTGAKVVLMAHQAGARKGTDGYLEMIDFNVRQIIDALGGGS
jgi:zinc/manganese transport system substrate-binding protein